MTDTKPTVSDITITATGALSEGQLIETLVDATAEKIGAALARWADECVAAGQPITAGQVDQVLQATVQRLKVAVGNALGRRNSPGIALLRSVTETRDQATAAAPRAPVFVPEYQEVETRAQFDSAGKMVGTKTLKKAVTR